MKEKEFLDILHSANEKENSVIFKVSGFIAKILFDENRPMIYLACPVCKRKVTEDNIGYYCEFCKKSHNTCNPQYMITAII